MNQELNARREPVARSVKGQREWSGGIQGQAIYAILPGIHGIPAHDGNQPGMNHVIGLYESTGESGRRPVDKSRGHRARSCNRKGNQRSVYVYGKTVGIVSVHEDAIQVQGAVVEVEVTAGAIKRFTGGQHYWRGRKVLTAEALHRTSVKNE